MAKKDLIKYLIEYNMEIPVFQVLAGMLVALILGLCIYRVYKWTYTGMLYSKEFNVTIVMISLITTLVIMIIGSNLALSLGLVGALSIIRFRTAVKDAKDAAYLFWAIGVGLSCGTGIYTIGIIGSFFIGATLVFLYKLKSVDEKSYLLVVSGQCIQQEALESLIRTKCKRFALRMSDVTADTQELTYELSLKSVESGFAKQIQESPLGVELVHLISYQGEIIGE